jgi:diacylglycerol kinase
MKDKNFLQSLKTAVVGLVVAFKEERNFRIQFLIAILVLAAAWFLKITAIETSVLIIMTLMVLSLELINSQIEKFLDLIQPDHHPRVKIIKDFSAGAVLLSALGSVAVGWLIFFPHISSLIN